MNKDEKIILLYVVGLVFGILMVFIEKTFLTFLALYLVFGLLVFVSRLVQTRLKKRWIKMKIEKGTLDSLDLENRGTREIARKILQEMDPQADLSDVVQAILDDPKTERVINELIEKSE